MSTDVKTIEELAEREYKWGFVSDIESESVPKGLNEDTIRLISAKKREPEFMLEWRLKAYRHWSRWRRRRRSRSGPTSTTAPSTIRTSSTTPLPRRSRRWRAWSSSIRSCCAPIEKLGIPLEEQKMLAGVAVDAVFDSVSVATTFKEKLEEAGVIFCSFSEAVQKHPELVKKYLGSVVPYTRQLFCRAECGGLHRRLVCLRAQGRALSDGAFHLLPHQRRRDRAV